MTNVDSNHSLTGSCACGAIRFEVCAAPEQILVCHCPDCRRAIGAHAVAWIMVADENFRITHGAPTQYDSSPGVKRSFCGACGTSLTWVGASQPGRIDITVGSLDHPERCVPTKAVYRRHRLPWASEI